MGLITITGWTADDKVPKFARQTTYGSGASSIGANPKYLLLSGTKTSAGSATVDVDIKDVLSQDDADAYFGAGSELAMMCGAALMVSGVTIKAIATAEAGGAAAGTFKIKITGTWSTAGTITFWLAGRAYSVSIGATDSKSVAAAAVTAAFNAIVRSPVTAADDGVDETTLTTKSKDARSNDWVLDYTLAQAPAGLGITTTGGSALNGNAKPFANGSGASAVVNALAKLVYDRYHYQAWAHYDGTAIPLIKAQLDSEAGPLVAHLEHAMFGSARAAATANSLSNTTLNHERCANTWLMNSQWPPSMIAAHIMAIRAVEESTNPNFNFDGYVTGIPAQINAADIAAHSTLKAALNNGVTPLLTTPDGKVVIVRGIVSHCKDGSNFDYSTLDWPEATVPDVISDRLAAQWETFRDANPYTGPDPADDEQPAPEGVGTPKLWNSEVVKILKDAEQPDATGAILVQDVDDNLPESQWDSTSRRILTACPVVVRQLNHQAGVDVKQTVAA